MEPVGFGRHPKVEGFTFVAQSLGGGAGTTLSMGMPAPVLVPTFGTPAQDVTLPTSPYHTVTGIVDRSPHEEKQLHKGPYYNLNRNIGKRLRML